MCARLADRSWWKPAANEVFPLADAVREGHERERRMWLPHIMLPGFLGTNVHFIYTPNRVLSHEDLPKIFNSKIREIEAQFTLHKTIGFQDLGTVKRKCKESPGLLYPNLMVPDAALCIVFRANFGFDNRGDLPEHEAFATFRYPHFHVYWDRGAWQQRDNFRSSFDLLLPYADQTVPSYGNSQGWKTLPAWSTLMKIRERCPNEWNSWHEIMGAEFQDFKWFFALDKSKCFEKRVIASWTHSYQAGSTPSQLIRIFASSESPPLINNTRPILDPQMLERYIADMAAQRPEQVINAETVLGQRANRLQVTDVHRQQLIQPRGTRVPAYIRLRQEEEEDEE
ncbi:hypothetical protein B0H13DRAFT_1901056 [Mycena leptocephala]|nr:hypothetical protein B0H13DRAFT_1901056 [Mycena leptocephala]